MITSIRPLVLVAALALLIGPPAEAQTPPAAKPDAAAPRPAPKAAVPAKRFASAEEATQALVAALRAGEPKALMGVLGSESRTLISSGDAVSDRQLREKFLEAYDTANRLIP